ncbi:hypothetical protein TRFO_41244 [Tritrichomonas foetus]|uniref:Uncharacterized protein n=1 Tax=Tritrichomonas foetus TaxID=1144522 RepID=A0A1J4L269_9EUKA|nr:hypothetical protein TRFO_41244 [Tritrichomonas foetus]|eukprot:OHT17176.1 hypothetical protein TRFO_41244 [Tritrichomonas foetus]
MIELLFTLTLALPSNHRLERDDTAKVYHFECFNIVRQVEREIMHDGDIANVMLSLKEHCQKLPEKRKAICSSIIEEEKIKKVYQLIQNNQERPESICATIGYPRVFGGRKAISQSQCVQILDLIKEENEKMKQSRKAEDNFNKDNDNNDENDDNHIRGRPKSPRRKDRDSSHLIVGTKVCNNFDEKDKMLCHIITRLAMRAARTEIEEGAESLAICKKLENQHLIQMESSEKEK